MQVLNQCKTLFLTAILFLTAGVSHVFAYNPPPGDTALYTDYVPDYTQWQRNYIIDKIEYTDKNTIVHFRFVSESESGLVTYYGPSGESPWYLKNLTPAPGAPLSWDLIEIRNITVNGVMKKKSLRFEPAIEFDQAMGDVHTCEVVFPRLPETVTKVDFIEGMGHETSPNHFNGFGLGIKPFKSEKLGTKKDMVKKIKAFEKEHGVESDIPEPVEEPEIIKAPEKPKEKKSIDVGIVFIFEQNSSKLFAPDLAYQYLDYTVNYLRSHPDCSIILHGHADKNLAADKATELSTQRAEVVKKYLLRNRIKEDRISVQGHGNEQLKNKDKVAGINRRVEIEFSCNK